MAVGGIRILIRTRQDGDHANDDDVVYIHDSSDDDIIDRNMDRYDDGLGNEDVGNHNGDDIRILNLDIHGGIVDDDGDEDEEDGDYGAGEGDEDEVNSLSFL